MTAFGQMRTWYDQLTPAEKSEIDGIRQRAGAPRRIVSLDHGETVQSHLDAACRMFHEAKDPFCLVRIGDADLPLLSGGVLFYTEDGVSLDKYLWHAGFDRRWFKYRGDYIEMAQGATLYGVHSLWKKPGDALATCLAMLDIPLPMNRALSVGVSYITLTNGALFSYLAGKRVLLVGGFAERLERAWKTPGFQKGYEALGFGPASKVQIIGSIPTAPRSPDKDPDEITHVLERASRVPFDVALIAAGGPGKIIAWRIWKQFHRTTLDVGAVFDALLGEHRQRLVFCDAKWPEVTW